MLVEGAGPTLAKGFATNLNVTQVPSAGSLETERLATIAQFESLHVVVGSIHSSYVRLPAGRAAKLVIHARYGTGSPLLVQTQFLLIRGRTTSVVTYSTLASAERVYRPTFERSASTFRFR